MELAPKFYKKASAQAISKEKKQEKLKPVFHIPSRDDSWRMSRKKGFRVCWKCCLSTWRSVKCFFEVICGFVRKQCAIFSSGKKGHAIHLQGMATCN